MSSPVGRPQEERQSSLPPYNVNRRHSLEKISDEDKTVVDDSGDYASASPSQTRGPFPVRQRTHSFLTADTAEDNLHGEQLLNTVSASQTREETHRLDDDIKLMNVERKISRIAEERDNEERETNSITRTDTNLVSRTKSRRDDGRDDDQDEFDQATNPIHETTQSYKPPLHPVSKAGKFFKKLHDSSWLVRNLVYATPVTLILLIPLLVGALRFDGASVGGVQLLWFMIWLEIVWLTLFAARLLAKCIPWPMGLVASIFTNNPKKWSDMGRQLELPGTLFFWWLAIEISFLPTMINHQTDGTTGTREWMSTTNKVLVSIFVGVILNFVACILTQLIAMSFHLRTYQSRIEINKFNINSLTKLYTWSKDRIEMSDRDFENPSGLASGARTPGAVLSEAQKQTKEAINRFGDVAGKIAGDFTGRKVTKSTHPSQVVLALLNTTDGSQVLARRLYRTFARPDTETIFEEDLAPAFDDDVEETSAAFQLFDKDLNGDISMQELEAVCVEIGRERKAITAALKDLDSVVSKLHSVFMFIVFVIVVLVFISLISSSAGAALTSAGSTVLALSWLLSATAQEFLQSIIFVFVKHSYDVGDRVQIYGNTGALGRGDDYFVRSISLLYTTFKKMSGEQVQAPNSYLNTLFILNHRRSGGLAEPVTIQLKFGTTLEQIDELRSRLLAFVKSEKRDFQGNILTELRELVEMHAINLNVIFFHKTSFQNEGARLARRNKFICAMMVTIQEIGIEGPRMRYPGQKESFPVYLQSIPHMGTPGSGHGGHPDNPSGWQRGDDSQPVNQDPAFVPPPSASSNPAGSSAIMAESFNRHPSIRGSRSVRRPRHESLSQMDKRVDFSLGMNDYISADAASEMYDDPTPRIPAHVLEASRVRERRREEATVGRSSVDVGRSSSFARRQTADNALARRSTESDKSRLGTHRNRFFSRQRHDPTIDEQAMMEGGMANIPENDHMDPRSGVISPAAYRMNSTDPGVVPTRGDTEKQTERTPELPPLALRTTASANSTRSHPSQGANQSAVHDFEMTKLR